MAQLWRFRKVSGASLEKPVVEQYSSSCKTPFQGKTAYFIDFIDFYYIPNIFTGPLYSLFRREWIVVANKCFSDGRQVLHEAWTHALISILWANITQLWEQQSTVPSLMLLRGFLDDIFDF